MAMFSSFLFILLLFCHFAIFHANGMKLHAVGTSRHQPIGEEELGIKQKWLKNLNNLRRKLEFANDKMREAIKFDGVESPMTKLVIGEMREELEGIIGKYSLKFVDDMKIGKEGEGVIDLGMVNKFIEMTQLEYDGQDTDMINLNEETEDGIYGELDKLGWKEEEREEMARKLGELKFAFKRQSDQLKGHEIEGKQTLMGGLAKLIDAIGTIEEIRSGANEFGRASMGMIKEELAKNGKEHQKSMLRRITGFKEWGLMNLLEQLKIDTDRNVRILIDLQIYDPFKKLGTTLEKNGQIKTTEQRARENVEKLLGIGKKMMAQKGKEEMEEIRKWLPIKMKKYFYEISEMRRRLEGTEETGLRKLDVMELTNFGKELEKEIGEIGGGEEEGQQVHGGKQHWGGGWGGPKLIDIDDDDGQLKRRRSPFDRLRVLTNQSKAVASLLVLCRRINIAINDVYKEFDEHLTWQKKKKLGGNELICVAARKFEQFRLHQLLSMASNELLQAILNISDRRWDWEKDTRHYGPPGKIVFDDLLDDEFPQRKGNKIPTFEEIYMDPAGNADERTIIDKKKIKNWYTTWWPSLFHIWLLRNELIGGYLARLDIDGQQLLEQQIGDDGDGPAKMMNIRSEQQKKAGTSNKDGMDLLDENERRTLENMLEQVAQVLRVYANFAKFYRLDGIVGKDVDGAMMNKSRRELAMSTRTVHTFPSVTADGFGAMVYEMFEAIREQKQFQMPGRHHFQGGPAVKINRT